jgi:hypothetical protein
MFQCVALDICFFLAVEFQLSAVLGPSLQVQHVKQWEIRN